MLPGGGGQPFQMTRSDWAGSTSTVPVISMGAPSIAAVRAATAALPNLAGIQGTVQK